MNKNDEPVQEPVAWQWLDTGTFRKKLPKTAERCAWNPLYTTPPQRKPLTDEEVREIFFAELRALPSYPSAVEELPERLARAIEQAHGIGSKT